MKREMMPETPPEPVERQSESHDALHPNYLEEFRQLRKFENDLPAERLKLGDPKYYQLKCRGNWWNSVNGWLQMMMEDGLADDNPSLKAEIQKFSADLLSRDSQKLRTHEEIDAADAFLDQVIAHLER